MAIIVCPWCGQKTYDTEKHDCSECHTTPRPERY